MLWPIRRRNQCAAQCRARFDWFVEHDILDSQSAQQVWVADLDGDGATDLIARHYNGSAIAWYKNDGFGNFSRQVIASPPGAVFTAFPADMDGDGDLDIVTSRPFDSHFDWYQNLTIVAGDFDGDGRVAQSDDDLWKSTFGSTTDLRADGNRDGQVDAADYSIWRAHLGIALATADYDGSGVVDSLDYQLWMNTFGSSTDLRADGNRNGIVDAADYAIWRDHLSAVRLLLAPVLPGDFNQSGTVDAADYIVWRHNLGSSVAVYSGADGNGNGNVDAADYDVWREHFGQTNLSGSGAGGPVSGEMLGANAPPSVTAEIDAGHVQKIVDTSVPSFHQTSSSVQSLLAYDPRSFGREPDIAGETRHQYIANASEGTCAAVRRDIALLDWITSHLEIRRPHEGVKSVRFVDDRAADESTGLLFGAVDEVFERLSTLPAVESQQPVNK